MNWDTVIIMGIPPAFTGFCFWLLKRHIDKAGTDTAGDEDHADEEMVDNG